VSLRKRVDRDTRHRDDLRQALPTMLIDEYRKAVRATYRDFHGPDSDRVPDAAE
jgi:hypothetical protein